jgi:hypothetical protein
MTKNNKLILIYSLLMVVSLTGMILSGLFILNILDIVNLSENYIALLQCGMVLPSLVYLALRFVFRNEIKEAKV